MRSAPGPFAATIVLVALTVGVFAPVAGFEFVAWDDPLLLGHPMVARGVDAESLRWLPTGVVQNNWTPVAWLSHMIDVSLYGTDAGGHHVTNLLWHLANVVLLFLGLSAITGTRGRSFVVAALFAIHPLHVESVAWVSERRDVLFMFFGLLTFAAHARWAQRREPWIYVAGIVALALGLLSKAMLVSMPILLLLMDLWPLDRRSVPLSRLLLEKVPHALLVVVFMVATLATQDEISAVNLGLGDRLGNAVVSYGVYLRQSFWPVDLAVHYPHPSLPGGPDPARPATVAAVLLLLVAISVGVLRKLRHPYLAVGWIAYGVSLVPVIGLVQVGQHAHADRYTYLPLVAIFLGLVWGTADALERLAPKRSTHVATAIAVVVIAACVVTSRVQVAHWRDSVTLFTHAVSVTEGNFQMHYNLANVLKGRGETDAAIDHYRQALASHPMMLRAHVNLANTLRAEERLDEAIHHYTLAADLGSDQALASLTQTAYARDGDLDVVVAFLRRRVEERPDSVIDRVYLGHTLRANGEAAAAAEVFRAAAALDPDDQVLQESMAELVRELEGA